MGKKAYIGVGGTARSVKQIYIGVGGKARKVKKVYIGVNGVARLAYQAGTPIGSFAVGSTVKIKENGSWVDYIIVHQGLPGSMYDASCNGTWLLRKYVAEYQLWHDARFVNNYANSFINTYLNKTFISRFEASVQGAVKQVKIPYCPGTGSQVNSGANGLIAKVFMPSVVEVGITGPVQGFPSDGTKLDYFLTGFDATAQAKRRTLCDGKVCVWWTRSPNLNSNESIWIIGEDGSFGNTSATSSQFGVRPAFILPASLGVEDGGYITG